MDAVIAALIAYGLPGMFIAAFLAGSVFPFSSEVVMLALLGAGVDPMGLLVSGTLGNTLGSLFNYHVGKLGKEEWIERFTKVSPEKLERGKRYVRRYGAWAGLLAWIPLLGSVITVALGCLRVNAVAAMSTIFVGKLIRYLLLLMAFNAL